MEKGRSIYKKKKRQKPREKNHGKETGSCREGDIRQKRINK
jgi:hypothetical protein